MRAVILEQPPNACDLEIGSKWRSRCVFLDDDSGQPITPTTVTFTLRKPYTASTTPAVTQEVTGTVTVYRVDSTVNVPGRWRGTWLGSGPAGDVGSATDEKWVVNID